MNCDKLLIFADTDMLQAKSSTEITIKGSGDARRYVRSARRIFSTLGGTLGKIITSVMAEERMDGLVEILRVYPQGLEARLDGRVHVLMGSSEFMRSNAIPVPSADAEMLARRSDDGSILYVAFGGQIRLGYEINYRIYKDFEQMAAQLAKGKTTVAIRSADPNITEDYLAASRVGKKTPIRLYKPFQYESRRVQESESSGIVSTGKIRSVARAVRMCEHIVENERAIVRLQWATVLCGAALAAVMAVFGNLGMYLSLLALVITLVFALPIKLLGGAHLTLEPWSDDTPSGKASGGPSAHRAASPAAKNVVPPKHK
jgi:hypothetical protein